jgi:hypothetical protein
MSGNGAYLLYRVDLPNDGNTTKLIKGVLHGLAERFDQGEELRIDTSTFNASRIAKCLGTMVRKGDDLRSVPGIEDRPHRRSWFERPAAPLETVSEEMLRSVAKIEEAPPPQSSNGSTHHPSGGSAAVERCRKYISKLPEAVNGDKGSNRTLRAACECFRFGLSEADAWPLLQEYNATHAQPLWSEKDLRRKLDEGFKKVQKAGEFGKHLQGHGDHRHNGQAKHDESDDEPVELPEPVRVGQLIIDHPRLAEPIVDGLLRRGETGNVIAAPKVGKSWLGYGLALTVTVGGVWLGRFECRRGRVLLIDNELHPATLAHRIPAAAFGVGVVHDDYAERLDVLGLRGRLTDLYGIAKLLEPIEPGRYDLIILDALYRAMPNGTSENDNASMAGLFNTIDQATARLDCAWLNIHHASKGEQGQKSITDVGAGAGSQSRAADAHIILRPHEEEGAVVLEAVVRSFKPVQPLPLRWKFPVWEPDDMLDPAAVRGRLSKQQERQIDRDQDNIDKLHSALNDGPATRSKLRGKTGFSKDLCDRLLDVMESRRVVKWKMIKVRGNQSREYQLCAAADDVVDDVVTLSITNRQGVLSDEGGGDPKGDRRPRPSAQAIDNDNVPTRRKQRAAKKSTGSPETTTARKRARPRLGRGVQSEAPAAGKSDRNSNTRGNTR